MKTSSFCGTSNSCVYVGISDNMVRVSNSKLGPKVSFTKDEWERFLQGAKVGEFDLTELQEVKR